RRAPRPPRRPRPRRPPRRRRPPRPARRARRPPRPRRRRAAFWVAAGVAITRPPTQPTTLAADAAVGADAELLHEPRVWPAYHPHIEFPQREPRSPEMGP